MRMACAMDTRCRIIGDVAICCWSLFVDHRITNKPRQHRSESLACGVAADAVCFCQRYFFHISQLRLSMRTCNEVIPYRPLGCFEFEGSRSAISRTGSALRRCLGFDLFSIALYEPYAQIIGVDLDVRQQKLVPTRISQPCSRSMLAPCQSSFEIGGLQ
jgi:hypothetical protein